MNKKDIGSSFDGWLQEEGIQEQVTAAAIKRVLARQIEAAMKEGKEVGLKSAAYEKITEEYIRRKKK